MVKKIHKTEKEWKEILTPEQFRVMRQYGTEAPFTCSWRKDEDGIYHCAACDLVLFRHKDMFDSGTGWPSYLSLSRQITWNISKTLPAEWSGKKSVAPAADRISAMYLATARLRQEKDTASIQLP